jgi:hypothetical protein
VPRQREIDFVLARAICKQLEIAPPTDPRRATGGAHDEQGPAAPGTARAGATPA